MDYDYKILAAVEFNDGLAFVLDKKPELKYVKKDGLMYGKDKHGIFYKCYYYDQPGKNWQAFAGRKFSIELENGEIEECHGQWWHGGQSLVEREEGVKLGSGTLNTTDALKNCYVYYGYEVDVDKYEEFISTYNGPIYRYYDYKKVLKYDDLRISGYRRAEKLVKDKECLIKEIRKKHNEVKRLREHIATLEA